MNTDSDTLWLRFEMRVAYRTDWQTNPKCWNTLSQSLVLEYTMAIPMANIYLIDKVDDPEEQSNALPFQVWTIYIHRNEAVDPRINDLVYIKAVIEFFMKDDRTRIIENVIPKHLIIGHSSSEIIPIHIDPKPTEEHLRIVNAMIAMRMMESK